MQIRLLNKKDIPELQKIHQRFFEKDFPFPDYGNGKFIGAYVVTDDYGKIISVMGVETLVELVGITDLSRSLSDRKEALLKLLQACMFTADKYSFESIHCFSINSPTWTRHLKKIGFRTCRGEALVIDV